MLRQHIDGGADATARGIRRPSVEASCVRHHHTPPTDGCARRALSWRSRRTAGLLPERPGSAVYASGQLIFHQGVLDGSNSGTRPDDTARPDMGGRSCDAHEDGQAGLRLFEPEPRNRPGPPATPATAGRRNLEAYYDSAQDLSSCTRVVNLYNAKVARSTPSPAVAARPKCVAGGLAGGRWFAPVHHHPARSPSVLSRSGVERRGGWVQGLGAARQSPHRGGAMCARAIPGQEHRRAAGARSPSIRSGDRELYHASANENHRAGEGPAGAPERQGTPRRRTLDIRQARKAARPVGTFTHSCGNEDARGPWWPPITAGRRGWRASPTPPKNGAGLSAAPQRLYGGLAIDVES